MDENNVLCPDCNENFITNKRLKNYGKCMSCSRRETMAKYHKTPYIKWKDLSVEEKQVIQHRRNIRNKKLSDVEEENTKSVVKSNIRKSEIYTSDVMNSIMVIANSNTTISELLKILKGMYPEKNITDTNLRNVINRKNIPYKKARLSDETNNEQTEIKEDIVVDSETSELNIDYENDINVEDDIDVISDYIGSVISKQEDNTNNVVNSMSGFNIPIKLEDERRFKPIKDEIDDVLSKRFVKENCNSDVNYTFEDYIATIEMLIFLKKNSADMIKCRKGQYGTMNAFQSDMIHTFENEIADEGDTSLSDKMHIIRQYRRYFENDYKNIAIFRPLIEMLDLDMLEKILESLKRNKNLSDNPIFKPLVDTSIIDKYEWAQPLDDGSYKARTLVTKYNPQTFQAGKTINGKLVTRVGMTPNTPPTSQLNSKTRKALKIFRVSCRISGGGYGLFKSWYHDYECTNSNIALSYAQNTLKQLSTNKKGMMWSDLDVVELNRGFDADEIVKG